MSVNTSELKRFRAEKDGVFARDPHSPLTDDQRRNFQGLEYFDENPQLVIQAGIDELSVIGVGVGLPGTVERGNLTDITCALWRSIGDPSRIDPALRAQVESVCSAATTSP